MPRDKPPPGVRKTDALMRKLVKVPKDEVGKPAKRKKSKKKKK
jgi:hypothetical protein